MIVLDDATKFISMYERVHKIRITRIPFTTRKDENKCLLMCKMGKVWVSLPYMSEGVIEQKEVDPDHAPFQFFESEEGNYISSSREDWQVRDTSGHSQYIYSNKVLCDITLDEENIWNHFSSNIKRKIRKAQKNGIEIQTGKSKYHVKQFHKVYKQRMQEIDTAVISRREVQRRVDSGMTVVFLAKKDGVVIGASTLNDLQQGTMINEYFATLRPYNKYYTSYLLHYAMLCYAKQNKASVYSLGRCTRGSNVHKYKKHFHPEEKTLMWSSSAKKKDIRDSKTRKKLWSLSPQWLKTLLSPIIAKKVY